MENKKVTTVQVYDLEMAIRSFYDQAENVLDAVLETYDISSLEELPRDKFEEAYSLIVASPRG
jgi:hypothetical protein